MKYLMANCRNSYDENWQKTLDIIENINLPNRKRALILIDKLKENINHSFLEVLKEKEFLEDVIKLFSYSQFLGEFFAKKPEKLVNLKKTYKQPFKREDFKINFPENLSETEFKKLIREYHRIQMARVVLRDILKLDTLTFLTRDTTLIHDSIMEAALKFSRQTMKKRYGNPENSDFVTVDMGKAAGCELNYSSDLDVLYVYFSRYGRTSGGSYGRLDNHQFFTILSEYITKLITENTKDGKCFELDLRLRPNGTMGPTCNDIEALEEYYTAVARPWERLALLKSRPASGDIKRTGVEFAKLVNPFVYRKYVDFTLIEEVLRLKELIKGKVSKKLSKIDVKLGKGGIREIEFIVQAFQLIYGGKNRNIRSKNTLIALEKLKKWGFLTEPEYKTLKESYMFLRNTEHMLQVTHFRQTQTFHPESEETKELALKLGFKTKEKFLENLKETMENVHKIFERTFPTGKKKILSSITVEDLKKKEFFEPEEIKKFIDHLFSRKLLSLETQNKLDLMGETFIDIIFEMPDSKLCMKNLVTFLEREEGRLFFSHIVNHTNTLKVILLLLSTKDFFIKRVLKTPEILEYIFDPRGIEEERTKEAVRETFKILDNPELAKNLEQTRTVLRKLLGRSDIETYNKEITNIADIVIEKVHSREKPKYAVASLGKHGSHEMNIGSDIDILFIFKSEKEKEKEKEKILHFIKELKSFDYEIDTRLRPFGEKGELGFTVKYLENYFKESGRVWEQLSYTRFRVILDTMEIKESLEQAVTKFIFSKPLKEILPEIEEMREKLEKQLGKKEPFKYGKGGIFDLEFIAYIYQLLNKEKIGNAFKVLEKLSEELSEFNNLANLYKEFREAETEKRLFGKFVKYTDKIENMKKLNRQKYSEFIKWTKTSLNMQSR